MSRTVCLAVLISIFANGAARAQAKDEIGVRVVKFDGLKKEVLKHRGKVVLVDIWATWCEPCIAGFPHLVEWHRKYAGDGLVIVTVNMNALDEKDVPRKVESTLKRLNATFVNLILDEDFDFTWKHLRCAGPPSLYVFSREGLWTQWGNKDTPDYVQIERLIETHLKAKTP